MNREQAIKEVEEAMEGFRENDDKASAIALSLRLACSASIGMLPEDDTDLTKDKYMSMLHVIIANQGVMMQKMLLDLERVQRMS